MSLTKQAKEAMGVNDRFQEGDEASLSSSSFPDEVTDSAASSPKTTETDSSEEDEIGKSETKAVVITRLMLALVLLVATVGTAMTVFFYLDEEQSSEFLYQFNRDADKAFDGVHDSVFLSLAAVDSFATTLASTADSSGQNWPYMSLVSY